MNFKKQFDKNINSLNAEINASFLVFGGNFRLYFVMRQLKRRHQTKKNHLDNHPTLNYEG